MRFVNQLTSSGSGLLPQRHGILASILLLIATETTCPIASGQTDLPQEEVANVLVEVDFAQWRKSRIFATMEEMNGDMFAFMLPIAPERSGAMLEGLSIAGRLPDRLMPLMEMNAETELPLSFLARMNFRDKTVVDDVFTRMKDSSDEDTLAGMDVYRPLGGPGNVAATVNERTLLIGSDNYLSRANSNLASDDVLNLVARTENAAVRFGIDLTDNKALLTELNMFAGALPPDFSAMLGYLPYVKSIGGRLDMTDPELLRIVMSPRTDADKAKVRELGELIVEVIADNYEMSRTSAPPGMEDADALIQELIDGMSVNEEGGKLVLGCKAPDDMESRFEKLLPGIMIVRDRAKHLNELKQIALAMHNYESVYRKLPQGHCRETDNNLSWRVLVTPFLEEGNLFNRVDVNLDHDSSANAFLANSMPEIFGGDGSFTGITAVKTGKAVTGFRDLTDGTSNTIAFLKLDLQLPWSAENDLTIDEIVKAFPEQKSPVMVAMYDGSVRSFPADIEPEKLRALLTPDGGEIVNW